MTSKNVTVQRLADLLDEKAAIATQLSAIEAKIGVLAEKTGGGDFDFGDRIMRVSHVVRGTVSWKTVAYAIDEAKALRIAPDYTTTGMYWTCGFKRGA